MRGMYNAGSVIAEHAELEFIWAKQWVKLLSISVVGSHDRSFRVTQKPARVSEPCQSSGIELVGWCYQPVFVSHAVCTVPWLAGSRLRSWWISVKVMACVARVASMAS